jgi:hypothetical protein
MLHQRLVSPVIMNNQNTNLRKKLHSCTPTATDTATVVVTITITIVVTIMVTIIIIIMVMIAKEQQAEAYFIILIIKAHTNLIN